jgi:hypothetical protein
VFVAGADEEAGALSVEVDAMDNPERGREDLLAGDARGHRARRVELALSAEHARSFAPRSGPPPDLEFHVRDEADNAHDDVVLLVLVRAGLGRGLGVCDCVVGSVALLRFPLL